jgi:hypothetical protein
MEPRGPKAAQDNLKEPKKAPKGHPKSSKALKKGPNMDPQIILLFNILGKFWIRFGAQIPPKREPQIGPVVEPSSLGSQRSGSFDFRN